MAKVIHFEIPAEDPQQSKEFYAAVFGWQFNQMGQEDYWLASTGPDEEPGIDGAIIKRKDPAQPVTNNIRVENIDAAAESICENGGSIVVEKMHIPNVGQLLFFKDPDGNIFGAFQPEA